MLIAILVICLLTLLALCVFLGIMVYAASEESVKVTRKAKKIILDNLSDSDLIDQALKRGYEVKIIPDKNYY